MNKLSKKIEYYVFALHRQHISTECLDDPEYIRKFDTFKKVISKKEGIKIIKKSFFDDCHYGILKKENNKWEII